MAVTLVLNQWVTVWTKTFSYTGFSGRLECQAQLTSQNVSKNQSTVKYWLGVYPDDYKYGESSNTTINLTGATTWNGYLKIGNGTAGQSYTTLRNSTVTLSHNADGTLTTTVAGSFSQVYYSGTLSVSSSGTATLPTIPRASSPTVNPSTTTFGDTVLIATNRKSSSFTHTLTIEYGSRTYTIATKTSSATVQFDTDSLGESNFMGQLANPKSSANMLCTINCTTYSGNTAIGSDFCMLIINVNKSRFKPTVALLSITDGDTTAAKYHSSWYEYINNVSKPQVQFSAGVLPSGTAYESLKKGVAKIGTNSETTNFASGATLGTFSTTSGIVASDITEVSGTVTDDRNTTATTTVQLQPIPYQKVSVTSTSVNRPVATDADIVLNIKGKAYKRTYTDYSVSPNVSTANSLTISTWYKLPSATTWTTGDTYTVALSGSDNSYVNFTIAQQLTETYDYQTQYDFKYKISDLFSSVTKTLRIYEGLPVFGWGENHFDVFGALHIHDRTNASTVAVLNASDLKIYEWHGTYTSPVVNYDSNTNNAPYAYRIGNLVFLHGIATISGAQTTDSLTMFTLPSQFRPTAARRPPRLQGSGVNAWLLTVNPNGNVVISRYGTTSTLDLPGSIWLPFDVAYCITYHG